MSDSTSLIPTPAPASAPAPSSKPPSENVVEALQSFLISQDEIARMSASERTQLYDKLQLILDGKISPAESGLLPVDRLNALFEELGPDAIKELDGSFEEYQAPSFVSWAWNRYMAPMTAWRLPRQLPIPDPITPVLESKFVANTLRISSSALSALYAARDKAAWYTWVVGSALIMTSLPIGLYSALDTGVASYSEFPSREMAHYPEALEM